MTNLMQLREVMVMTKAATDAASRRRRSEQNDEVGTMNDESTRSSVFSSFIVPTSSLHHACAGSSTSSSPTSRSALQVGAGAVPALAGAHAEPRAAGGDLHRDQRAARRGAARVLLRSGVMQDLLTQTPLGLYALSYGLVGMFVVSTQEVVYREHPLTHFSLALVGGLLARRRAVRSTG